MIATGRVTVNGNPAGELGTKADPEKDVIKVDGKRVRAVQEKLYILLNKPPGYTSTRSDPHAERTVMELVKDIDAFLYPVGRLDVDTSGLLILTNDGDFAQLLTHPSHEIEKTYVAVVRGKIRSSSLSAFERGIEIEDGVTAPAKARLLSFSTGTNSSTVEITIHEGKKRQVRRMFAAVGHKVDKLERTRLGGLDLRGLDEGKYRLLTKKELGQLTKLARPQSQRQNVARDRGARRSPSA